LRIAIDDQGLRWSAITVARHRSQHDPRSGFVAKASRLSWWT